MKTVHNKGIEPTGNSLCGFLQRLVAPVGSCPALYANRKYKAIKKLKGEL